MDIIESIELKTIETNDVLDSFVIITDIAQIKDFSRIIETAEREPVKFVADYQMTLNFKDSSIMLLIKNDLINDKGLTYRTNENLGQKIKLMLIDRK